MDRERGPHMRKLVFTSLILLLGVSAEARLRIDGTTCLAVESDQIYHDTNCDGVKDVGENFVDASGSGTIALEDGLKGLLNKEPPKPTT